MKYEIHVKCTAKSREELENIKSELQDLGYETGEVKKLYKDEFKKNNWNSCRTYLMAC